MGTRRFVRVCLWAMLAGGAALGGGCAQSAKTQGEPAAASTTEEMVERSAEAMKRFLTSDTPDAPAGADAAVSTATAGGPTAPVRKAEERAPAPVIVGAPARVDAPAATPSPAAPVAAPARVAAQAEVAPLSARSAEGGGMSGFFSDSVVASERSAPATTAKGPTLRIAALALCSRVEGFGRFTRVESARATGRAVPLLIYTQVEGFAHRPGGGGAEGADDGRGRWVVDLGQTVVVYRLGADGREPDEQVLYIPEQACRDEAVGKRRDHFLVQRIDLSPWLTAGKYAVKVTLRDKATGQVDERITEVSLR